MARKLRAISPTGVYHVCLRGVNKQRIFEYSEDYDGFYRILHNTMFTNNMGMPVDEPNFDLFAYCLMDNHIHMLIGTRKIALGDVIKRIACSYAQFFNLRYKRVGHLFQDRYHSEVCADTMYYYTLLTYIHNNPVKAGICQRPAEYRYSSFAELTAEHSADDALCTALPNLNDVSRHSVREWLLDLNVAADKEGDPYATVRHYIADQYYDLSALMNTCNLATTSDEHSVHHLTSQEVTLVQRFANWCQSLLCSITQAKNEKVDVETLDGLIIEALLGLSGTMSINEFQRLDKKTMRNTLAQVRDAGISISRLSRISGISEGIIRTCKNPNNLHKGV